MTDTTMNRVKEIDYIRGIAMIMVVVGHTQCPYLLHGMVNYVHIPLFFMLSGCTNRADYYYYELANLKSFVIKRIRSLYLPYLLFALIIIFFHNVFFSLNVYEKYYSIYDFVSQLLRTFLFSIGTDEPFLRQLWFMKTLFLCEIYYGIIVYGMHKINLNKYYLIVPLCGTALFLKGSSCIQIQTLNSSFLWPLAAIIYYILGGGTFFENHLFLEV